LVGTGEIASTVGFDTTAIALSLEGLGLALSHAATLGAFRAVKLMSPAVSDLPRFLTPLGGTRTGFATVQKTISALESEIRHLAQPVGALSVPVADGIEDYAPMTPRVAEKTRELVRRLAALAAVELVVAAQAVDLRGGMRLGKGTRAAHRFVRSRIAFLDEDRPLGGEIHELSEAILAGTLREALAG
ncbi:MAG TPA: aromatic amino acid lyase, partial [Salinarimonas sp.]|nr:aromatic amino acid lyase [Salinarimonas sp.]